MTPEMRVERIKSPGQEIKTLMIGISSSFQLVKELHDAV